MQLTLVIHALGTGGAERVLTRMANHWAKHGVAVTILTFDDGRVPPTFPLEPNVKYRPLGIHTGNLPAIKKIFSMPRILRRLRRAVIDSKPDRVITFVDQTNVLTLLALVGTRIPVIVSERADPARTTMGFFECGPIARSIARTFRRLVYRLAEVIVVQTSGAREYFSGSQQSKIEVIPNFVVLDTEPSSDTDLLPNSILGMGRLVPQKRFDRVIRAFGLIANHHPGWNLAIVGEGPQRETLLRLIEELGLSDRVRMHGITSTPFAVIAQSEIFVLSSDFEGFPGVLCEAMASGKPCIATRCRFGPEVIIKDGINGLMVDLDDHDLARALAILIESPPLRVEFGGRAKEILSQLALPEVMKSWDRLIYRKKGFQ